ncbi:MAG: acyltransferase [Tannerellaceae bacterium]|jgi:peptidoglycan/LPS O-acetylase OafA/YrhL|nr:acyltransferase [Tannerellaceae bacterium]
MRNIVHRKEKFQPIPYRPGNVWPNPPASERSRRIGTLKGVQMLRGISALFIVYAYAVQNYFPEIEFGKFSADIFFVISGFAISLSVSNSGKSFLLKRIIRLMPLYWLAVFATVSLYTFYPKDFHNATVSLPDILRTMFFVPFTDGAKEAMLPQGWTLPFEVLFYLTVAGSLLLIRNHKRAIYAAIPLLIIIPFALNYLDIPQHLKEEYSRWPFFLEFIYGIIAWRIYSSVYKRRKLKYGPFIFASLIAIILLSYALFILSEKRISQVPFDIHISWGLLSFILLMSMLLLEEKIKKHPLSIKPLIKIGMAGYSVCLLHPFVIFFLQKEAYPKLIGEIESPTIKIIELIVAYMLAIICSLLIHVCLDKQIQKKLRNIFISD